MQTIALDLLNPIACPQCSTVFQQHGIIQSRNSAEATALCKCCSRTTRITLPELPKKLVYLDQSFLSDVLPSGAQDNPQDIKQRILHKLLELKARQQIFIVVSDIHFAETAAISDEWIEKRRRLLSFQNELADGSIAADVLEIFTRQQRRKLINELEPDSFHPGEVGLKDPFRLKVGVQIVPTNTWLGRLHQPLVTAEQRGNQREMLRRILVRQASELSAQSSKADCLDLVRNKWRLDLQKGIAGERAYSYFIAQMENLSDASSLPAIPEQSIFRPVVQGIVKGLDSGALDRFEQLLKDDPTGGCASVQLRTALEAEVLWAWCSCERTGDAFNDKKYGVSRLNDINHISTFLPYVDALTTDGDSAKLCQRDLAAVEVNKAKGKLFSAATYGEFERWLDDLRSQSASGG